MPWYWAAIVLAAYLLGSIPSGLLIGNVFYGIDIRDYGSRRTGATNVLRTMGKKAAAAAIVMDAAKGALAVVLARLLLPDQAWAHVLAALSVAIGHNWPVFIGFRGGRGVLVSLAAVGVLYLPVLLILLAAGIYVIWRTRYVSLASVVGAAITPLLFLVFHLRDGEHVPLAYVLYAAIGAAVVIFSHRDNLARLRTGTESRFGQRVNRAA